MTDISDGIIKDWGERLFEKPLKGKKGKTVLGAKYSKPPPKQNNNASSVMEKVSRTTNKTPEVMVKISGGGKNMKHIKAHMDYISRNGEIDLEDENGNIHTGKDVINDIRDSWAYGKFGISNNGEKRKEAFNIVLSMPAGTHRQAVKDAARDFAKEQFKDHQYLFAAHKDEDHPHVHLTVKATDKNGIRLNPRKADLQYWRESFAEKLRENGIEANATPRRVRGVVRKRQKQAIRHIDKDYKDGERKEISRATKAQIHTAKTGNEVDIKTGKETGEKHINPAKKNIKDSREQTQKNYGIIAKGLLIGDEGDKKLALEIAKFVKNMPKVSTKHQDLVNRIERKGYTKLKTKEEIQEKRNETKDIER